MRFLALLLLLPQPILAQSVVKVGANVAIGALVAITTTNVHNSSGGSADVAKDSNGGTTTGEYFLGNSAALNKWEATRFTAGSTYTLHKVVGRLWMTNTPVTTVTAYIYSDSAGTPGAQLGSASTGVAMSTFPGTEGDVSFIGLNVAITSGTVYWVVLSCSASDANNFAFWAYNTVGSIATGSSFRSSNGSSWGLVDKVHLNKITTWGQ